VDLEVEEEVIMRVVIVGLGDVGRDLAKNLARRENNELVLIDADEKRCQEVAGEIDALVLHGDGTDPDILKKARAGEADALVATTDSDAMNTVIAMLGHRMGVKKIIVKLNGVGLRAACQEVGVSKIISPKISAAAEILASLYGFDRLDFSLVIHGGLRLVELGVGKAQGRHLSEIGLPGGALVVAVVRGSQTLVPRGSTKFEEGDSLLFLADSEAVLEKVRSILGP
jgi:trk system potassium uptake protein